MARQKCTFKWQNKSVRGKTKLQHLKSVRLNGKTKVYV